MKDFFSEIQILKRVFSDRTPVLLNPEVFNDSLIRAAVILPLVSSSEGMEILFTLRSEEVKDHKGQISFPGGVIEESDESPLVAAIRETSEELGIGKDNIQIICQLDSYITVTGYLIAVFLGYFSGSLDFEPHQKEIREVFTIPVKEFLKPGLPERLNYVHEGVEREVFIYNVRGRTIWGATARILKNFFDIAGGIFMRYEESKKRVIERLLNAQKIVIMTHEGADPDAIGCEVALGSVLEQLGKMVVIMNNEPVISKFSFLDPRSKITVYSSKRENELKNCDLIVLLDTSEVRRTGKASRELIKYTHKITYIDHHQPQPEEMREAFDIEGLSIPSASSTGEILLDVIEMLPVKMNLLIASQLLAAIIFDTFSFRYIKNNPSSLLKAAKLISFGADATAIQNALFSSKKKDFLMLLGRAFEKMQFLHGERLAYSTITKEMTSDITVDRDDLRNVITYLIEIGSVEAAILFKEMGGNKVKVSIRAKNTMSVLDIAQKFGGGGHTQAAGCDINGSLEEVKEKILKEFEKKFPT